ncbi:MAG TPA: type II secretion system protein GspM [Gammaproteobacteria bacterium]|nr:type II secretion system protein GspM [Gammaproteobacteria bacterium]
MRRYLQRLAARFDALTLRERTLGVVTVLVVLGVLWNMLLMAPMQRYHSREQARLKQLRHRISQLDRQSARLVQSSGGGSNAALRKQIAALQTDIAGLDTRLHKAGAGLIDPKDMPRVLEKVLERQKGLKLTELHGLPAKPLLPAGKKGDPPRAQVYRHGIVIEFDGSYLATMRYLESLQKLKWRFFWDRVDFQVKHWPRAHVRLVVYTLGLREGWVGV